MAEKDPEDENFMDSDDYEASAREALADGNHAEAQVFASLALVAAVREAVDDVLDAMGAGSGSPESEEGEEGG